MTKIGKRTFIILSDRVIVYQEIDGHTETNTFPKDPHYNYIIKNNQLIVDFKNLEKI